MPSSVRRALPNAITIAQLGLAVLFFLLLQAIGSASSAEAITIAAPRVVGKLGGLRPASDR